mmetsp:Transcript_104007/g.247530  ORF Transcript_104007/g.247530 Transcript_104007/m.247530 type:complete len:283 (+) Transcript_104007:227-1075(+)
MFFRSLAAQVSKGWLVWLSFVLDETEQIPVIYQLLTAANGILQSQGNVPNTGRSKDELPCLHDNLCMAKLQLRLLQKRQQFPKPVDGRNFLQQPLNVPGRQVVAHIGRRQREQAKFLSQVCVGDGFRQCLQLLGLEEEPALAAMNQGVPVSSGVWIHVQHASCTGRAGDDKALHGLGVVLVLQHPRLKCLHLAFCPCLVEPRQVVSAQDLVGTVALLRDCRKRAVAGERWLQNDVLQKEILALCMGREELLQMLLQVEVPILSFRVCKLLPGPLLRGRPAPD